jgi:acetyltransferase
MVAEVVAATPDEAIGAAEQIGYPVVVKIEAPGLAHKAAAGGVMLNIRDAVALESASNQLARVRADATGVVVQQMVTDGIAEVILGMSKDPQFGPVIACGLGGVFVETMRDVQLLLPPLTTTEVQRALDGLRGAPLLARADRSALIDIIVRFSELCMDLHHSFSAIDLNPLIVRPESGVVAVDSLFELDRA